MSLTRLLGFSAVLCALFVTGKCQGLDCGEIFDIRRSRAELLINTSANVCVQCLASGANMPSSDTGYLVGGLIVSGVGVTPVTVPGLVVMGGVLGILDPAVVPDGEEGLELECQGNFRYTDINLFSNNIVAPTTTPPTSLTLQESQIGQIVCNNNNNPLLGVTDIWFNPAGEEAAEGRFNILTFTNISRTQAGVYVCQQTASDNSMATVAITVTVEFSPEVTASDVPPSNIPLGNDMTLRCDFEGVPTPSLVWTHNSTVQLNDSDPRITITTQPVNNMNVFSSVLTVTDLGRDSGGLYTCTANNSVNDNSVDVITVLVLIPPAPATDLQVPAATIQETQLTVTWVKGFDGFTPITGATIQYSAEGGPTMTTTVNSETDTSATISNLMPFTNHTIIVSLFNVVGTGDNISIVAQTRSLQLAAPVNVMVTVLNSTALRVDWDAPPQLATTDSSDLWLVEIMDVPLGMLNTATTDAQTTTMTFDSLRKGTQYSVRVRGENEVGPGNYSNPMVMETAIDPPSEPLNVRVTGPSAFALRVMWDPPVDNGGRPIVNYIISVENFVDIVSVSVERNILIREEFLMNSTTYTVSVAAQNELPLNGSEATALGTTLSIDKPQPILDNPTADNPMNTSIILTWEDVPGEVDNFLIVYRENVSPDSNMSMLVDGDLTAYTLTGLEPMTSYTVEVFTVNSNGRSVASPAVMFTTTMPDPPVVTRDPAGRIFVGSTVVLTCTTPDITPDIMWTHSTPSGGSSTLDLSSSPFEPEGTNGMSNLTITNIQMIHAGVYACRVREMSRTINITVEEMEVQPTESAPISTTVIIAVCAGGGGLLLLIIIVISIIVMYFCCCRSKDSSQKYVTNKSALKPDKRTNELFEVSAAYAPVKDVGSGEETGVTFNMPEDYHTHSSFNTMERVDKPDTSQQRSSSPEPTNTSSFGVGTGSPPRYQDMPSPSKDGTLL